MDCRYYKYDFNFVMIGGNKKQETINKVLEYAKSLIGIPYRWHKEGDSIYGIEDKFYAKDGPMITAEDIKNADKCIVCTGLVNLMRRFLGLSIPGSKSKAKFTGTTGRWFYHLKKLGRLEELDVLKKYPKGTMLLRNFNNIVDQGHVAVIISDDGRALIEQDIIHAFAGDVEYKKSTSKTNAGSLQIQKFTISHYGWHRGQPYYTHICLPKNWILKD